MAEIKGGDALDKKLKELADKLGKGGAVKVGFLENATYPDGTPVAMVAAIQNFGAPSRGIPPRPFFTNMVKTKSPEWGPAMAMALESTQNDAEKALAIVGQGIKGQLQQSIIDTDAPPLSPITLMLRKMQGEDSGLVVTGATVGEAARRVRAGESSGGVSTKPLVWSGHLLDSVDYEVVK